jgi:membrane-associated protease RseP (regulator of RpoE activity)
MFKQLNSPVLRTASALALAFALSAPAQAYQGYGWSGGMGKAYHDCHRMGPGHPKMMGDACPYHEKAMKMPRTGPSKSLGVMVHDLNDAMLDQHNLGYGIRVARVQPESAAAAAGLMAGDLIVEFNGKPIYSGDRLRWLVRQAEVGKNLEIKLHRDGKPMTLNALLNEPVVKPKSGCDEREAPRIGT